MKVPVQFYLEETDYEQFKKFVEYSNSDVSKMLRAILKSYMSKRPKYD